MEDVLIILSVLINIMLTIMVVIFFKKLKRVEGKYNDFISKFDKNENIEGTLKNYIDLVSNVNEESKIMQVNYKNLERQLNKCAQKIGMVRYNAFNDVGSDLSFALAILDNDNNGFVLNAIYARNSSNIYAKPIENGTSRYTLSEEEIKAVSRAKEDEKI